MFYPGKFNPFVPAHSGESPACAKKGASYCEYIQDYPMWVLFINIYIQGLAATRQQRLSFKLKTVNDWKFKK